MHGGNVLQHHFGVCGHAQGFRQPAMLAVVRQIAKQPRLPLGTTANHHPIGLGIAPHRHGLLRAA